MGGKKQKRPNPRASRSRGATRTRWLAILLAIVLIAGAGWWYARRTPAPATTLPSPLAEVRPTVENKTAPPANRPEGMVWIPGGEFSMGARDPMDMQDTVGMQATTDSRPIHRVAVNGFWMDATEVTNEQFARFVAIPCFPAPAGESPTYAARASGVDDSTCFQASSSLFVSTRSNSRAQNG